MLVKVIQESHSIFKQKSLFIILKNNNLMMKNMPKNINYTKIVAP